jgi:hypothetical protein
MRRIIERVVTVVTTTTWKISWETDSPPTSPQVDPVVNDLSSPDVFSETPRDSQASSQVIETEEVESAKIDSINDQHESYPYQTKIERKSKP